MAKKTNESTNEQNKQIKKEKGKNKNSNNSCQQRDNDKKKKHQINKTTPSNKNTISFNNSNLNRFPYHFRAAIACFFYQHTC